MTTIQIIGECQRQFEPFLGVFAMAGTTYKLNMSNVKSTVRTDVDAWLNVKLLENKLCN